ncbi:hypothetical protein [Falsiroseomonas sp. HW251]|uniref:hypothetical protein n=1 Tax=Falsiroseomonas sp. HW251 TaxID=3390998 RepID=UPI003D31578F
MDEAGNEAEKLARLLWKVAARATLAEAKADAAMNGMALLLVHLAAGADAPPDKLEQLLASLELLRLEPGAKGRTTAVGLIAAQSDTHEALRSMAERLLPLVVAEDIVGPQPVTRHSKRRTPSRPAASSRTSRDKRG